MKFLDLRSLIRYLESSGKLVRVKKLVDPNQEIAIIQHRVARYGGPALLFENVKNSSYRVVTNLFGAKERVNLVFGGNPSELGEKLVRLFHMIKSPSVKSIFRNRRDIIALLNARKRNVRFGPVMEVVSDEPNLERFPVLTLWPGDGGPFFTLPLVYTTDPQDGSGNLGMYRLQKFSHNSTGMHWQIEKGGGFHFHKAVKRGESLPVSVIFGGPPSLTIAAIAPLPEGIDEFFFAAFMMGKPIDVIFSEFSGHKIPVRAEFVLEGTVTPGDVRKEGPFGDHFGHYSSIAEYPVFRVKRVLARSDAIYPATVVGKPIQEDFYIGEALQEMSIPLIKLIRPAVADLWAYPETGFHPLAVLAVRERYPNEAFKHTLGMLGEGQMSLTKVMITVGDDVNVRDIYDVSRAIWKYLDLEKGFHLLAPTQQDTLDFTGPRINEGSRLILLATNNTGKCLREPEPNKNFFSKGIHKSIIDICSYGPAFLLVKVKNSVYDIDSIREALCTHDVAGEYLFHVLVSEDIPLENKIMTLWGWFTRFDPATDLYPSNRRIKGNQIVFDFPILIDARWKKKYPKSVEFDSDIEKKINESWSEFCF